MEDAMAYAMQRIQCGQRICDFQAIRFKVDTVATEVEAARQLMYHVCTALDSGYVGKVETSMIK